MLQNTKSKGFTLVELLIVIVVIAILAAISIVAYNGIQNRGKTSSAASAASTIQKKAEAHNAIESNYPSNATDFNTVEDSSLAGSGITVVTSNIAAAPDDPATVFYVQCGSGTGANIHYWDYSTGARSTTTTLGTC